MAGKHLNDPVSIPGHSTTGLPNNSPTLLVEPLTRREREILEHLAGDLYSHEIAAALTLSPNSIKWYTRQIFAKLGVNNRKAAVRRARELGLLETNTKPVFQPHALPADLTPFVGRQAELEQVRQMLADPVYRLLTLMGAGGVGKTRLALRAADELQGSYPQGAWFVELASLSEPELVPQTVAAAFDLRPERDRSSLDGLMDFLQNKDLLLVLDNCEHLVAACASLANSLLPCCPNLHILATSREALGIEAERTYLVPSLTFPESSEKVPTEELTNYSAIDFFTRRAKIALPDFELEQSNAAAVTGICRHLDGIPLAIELAAARLRAMDVNEIASQLEHRFHLLTGGDRTAHPRLQTMHASIDWSFQLLTQAEKTLLGRSSVFAGSWSLAAARTVCSDDSLPQDSILDLLGKLVDKSLVQVQSRNDQELRYRLLEIVRQYAAEKSTATGESKTLRDRHMAYFIAFVEKAEPELDGTNSELWLRHLNDEMDNLRLALEWSLSNNLDAGLRLANIVGLFWEGQDYTPELPDAHCPFKGLQYFEQADAELFFGRELLVARLVERLRTQDFLAVVGASGSGKSSIVRAGVVPALRGVMPLLGDALPPEGCSSWPVHILTPGARPLLSLALSLADPSASVSTVAALVDDLRRDPLTLRLTVQKILGRPAAPKHLLLVMDQFEELFSLCADLPERKALVDNLLNAVTGPDSGQLKLILTLRADFYAHCAQYPNLRAALVQCQEFIGAMSADELRRAIEEPAHRGGWELEPGLVETLLKDVGDEPGALPLLSHALLETWKRHRGSRLTLRGYAFSGGVRGAIARTADSVYDGLPPEQQAIARIIFLRLTELGEGTQDTRRRAMLAELAARPEDVPPVQQVLKTLTDARLLTTTDDSVEVSHEAIIREWPQLRLWLDEDRAGLRLQRQLTDNAGEWSRRAREPGLLYRGRRLAQAGEWADSHSGMLNALEREFLSESQAAQEREAAEKESQRRRLAQTQRQRTLVLSVGLVVALLLAGLALLLYRQSTRNLTTALTEAGIASSRRLAAQAISLRATQPDLALLLGIESFNTADTFEARNSLLSNLQYSPRLLKFLYGNARGPVNVAYSPDGKTLASGSCGKRNENGACIEGEIILWDVSDPTRATSISATLTGSNTSEVTSLAFSPDGKTLASGNCAHLDPLINPLFRYEDFLTCTSGEITLWDVRDLTHITPLGVPLTGSRSYVSSLAFSRDGKLMASGDFNGNLIVWDTSSPAKINSLSQGQILVAAGDSLVFSPDGKTLVSGGCKFIGRANNFYGPYPCTQSEIILWDVSNLADVRPLGAPLTISNRYVYSVAYSPDGKTLAAGTCGNLVADHGCTAGEIRLWDVSDPADVKPLGNPITLRGGIQSVRFSPDGKTLVSGSDEKTILFWDVSNPAQVGPLGTPMLGHTGRLWSLAFSPNGETLASGDCEQGMAGSCLEGRLILWDVREPARVVPSYESLAYPVTSVAFSPVGSGSGNILASAGCGKMDQTQIQTCYQGLINLWDPSQPAGSPPISTLTGHTESVSSLAISPDGKTLASGGRDNSILLWDVTDPAHARLLGAPLSVHTNWVSSLAFSPDRKTLASGSQDDTVILWNVIDPSHAIPVGVPLSGHSDSVTSVAFSPDGKTLASGSKDNTILIWDVSAPSRPARLARLHSDSAVQVDSLVFSPDGNTLAAGVCARLELDALCIQGEILLWDVRDPGNAKLFAGPLTGHTGWINSLAFSPDGRILASGSFDNSVRLWDVIDPAQAKLLGAPLTGNSGWSTSLSFNPLAPPTGHSEWVTSLSFSPDGKTLASGSQDGTLLLWDVGVDAWEARACQIADRNLTQSEWQQYLGDRPYSKSCVNLP